MKIIPDPRPFFGPDFDRGYWGPEEVRLTFVQ